MARVPPARRPSSLVLLAALIATLAFGTAMVAAHDVKVTRRNLTRGPVGFAEGETVLDEGTHDTHTHAEGISPTHEGPHKGDKLILAMGAGIIDHGELHAKSTRHVVCTCLGTDEAKGTGYLCTTNTAWPTGTTVSQGTLWRSAGNVLAGSLAVVGGTDKEFRYVSGWENFSYDMNTGKGATRFQLK